MKRWLLVPLRGPPSPLPAGAQCVMCYRTAHAQQDARVARAERRHPDSRRAAVPDPGGLRGVRVRSKDLDLPEE